MDYKYSVAEERRAMSLEDRNKALAHFGLSNPREWEVLSWRERTYETPLVYGRPDWVIHNWKSHQVVVVKEFERVLAGADPLPTEQYEAVALGLLVGDVLEDEFETRPEVSVRLSYADGAVMEVQWNEADVERVDDAAHEAGCASYFLGWTEKLDHMVDVRLLARYLGDPNIGNPAPAGGPHQ